MEAQHVYALPCSDEYLGSLSREELIDEVLHLQYMIKVYQESASDEINQARLNR